MKQIDLREGARRQHRAIALFAVIQCWLRGLDGIVFRRSDLERLLGLERFKDTRVHWLREDLREMFPHQRVIRSDNSFSALYICRSPFAAFLPKGLMTTRKRLEGIGKEGPQMALFQMWPRAKAQKVVKAFEGMSPFFSEFGNYDERLLSSYLSLLIHGQISPQSLIPKKKA